MKPTPVRSLSRLLFTTQISGRTRSIWASLITARAFALESLSEPGQTDRVRSTTRRSTTTPFSLLRRLIARCTGIFVAGTSAYPISGVEFANNDVSDMGSGYWFFGSQGTITDITINGGKFTNVGTPISTRTTSRSGNITMSNRPRRPGRIWKAGRRWTHQAIFRLRAGFRVESSLRPQAVGLSPGADP